MLSLLNDPKILYGIKSKPLSVNLSSRTESGLFTRILSSGKFEYLTGSSTDISYSLDNLINNQKNAEIPKQTKKMAVFLFLIFICGQRMCKNRKKLFDRL